MRQIQPKKTLVEQTYETLVDAICSGELPPGERLAQEEIATRLNVSRQPVNNALACCVFSATSASSEDGDVAIDPQFANDMVVFIEQIDVGLCVYRDT